MRLYCIGGASGSGKTAVIPYLKTLLGETISIYDFDDIGVPETADKKWRQKTSETWLQTILEAGKDACLLGQVVLGELMACPSVTKLEGLHFCLLDVHDFERIQRLQKRGTYGADQLMLNWAAWLRMHTQDPSWEPHVIKEDAWDGLDFSVWDHKTDWSNAVARKLLDTTSLNLQDVVERIVQWIQGIESKIDLPDVIFLNGPSSSGKSTLAKHLQDVLPVPYLHISMDQIIAMMPEAINDWTGGKVEQGFWFDFTKDEAGHQLAHLRQGPFAKTMSSFLKEVVVLALHKGRRVIVDEICVTEGSFAAWQHILRPWRVFYVGLKASTDVLEAREKAREDRMLGSARAQHEKVHTCNTYDLELDTSVLTPSQCVEKIIALDLFRNCN